MSTTETIQARLKPQQRLSKFLYAELLHTLGAYRLAERELGELRKQSGSQPEDKVLRDVIEQSRLLNVSLRKELHKPQLTGEPEQRWRHPSPLEKHQETIPRTPEQKPNTDLLTAVHAYYQTADEALGHYLQAVREGRETTGDGELLGERLAYIHDPQRRGRGKDDQTLVEDRRRRTRHRIDKVDELFPVGQAPVAQPEAAGGFGAILEEDMSPRSPGDDASAHDVQPRLHLTVIRALGDAHDLMHECEHLHSKTFGEMFSRIQKTHVKTEAMLKRSIVLNTFVYVAARSAPWIFAASEEERLQVIDGYDHCHRTLTPTYCMWIANQIGLLALERRAYTWWTMGRHDRAYRDFYKVIRLLKGVRKQIDERAMRVPGTERLVIGLTATAEHHIGSIYRGQHAHRVAVRYFDRASAHLDGWEDHDQIGEILKNSRWRVSLLMSRGKANYELGRMKRSLLSYAEAWQGFLELAASESGLTANLDVVEELIDWLKSVESEPTLSRLELRERLAPLVTQFESVHSPAHLCVLAADIMTRLGHLLYVLKLPPLGWTPDDATGQHLTLTPDYELARRCMFQAADLDQTSTLVATDLLKIRHEVRRSKKAEEIREGRCEVEEPEPSYPDMAPLDEQWPGGGGRFEEAARAIEYIVQTWLDSSSNELEDGEGRLPDEVEIARQLLRSFLTHTDSSNVKLAQVYRYLMQKPREVDREAIEPSTPTLEIVCLRRYSSFFPFLPRPAAFRALGGGYLVQVHQAGEKPFGIAIDPGPHFLNNLYRCGYGLADIQMIIATHDHADHIASLDALLALIGYRGLLGDDTFGAKNRLLIVGNASVVKRYSFYNRDEPIKREAKRARRPSEPVKPGDDVDGTKRAKRLDAVRVMSFSQFNRITDLADPGRRQWKREKASICLTPDCLRIQPIRTIDHFDAAGHISQGFLLSVGRTPGTRSSVLFTGDTGPQPSKRKSKSHIGPRHHFARGTKSLKEAAAEADVVIAHLSSVPLPELRNLAGFAAVSDEDEPAQRFIALWKKAARSARKDDSGAAEARFLLQQLQFAFRSRGWDETFAISPFSHTREMRDRSEKHLFLSGVLDLAVSMAEGHERGGPKPLMLIGELREELGTFRTRIATRITETVFGGKAGTALTTDIGLRLRVSRRQGEEVASVSVLCTTCDLDNDLVTGERFHPPEEIREVCVKGENESVFYNCELHDPGRHPEVLWVESVERYNVFGD